MISQTDLAFNVDLCSDGGVLIQNVLGGDAELGAGICLSIFRRLTGSPGKIDSGFQTVIAALVNASAESLAVGTAGKQIKSRHFILGIRFSLHACVKDEVTSSVSECKVVVLQNAGLNFVAELVTSEPSLIADDS